MVSEYRKIRMKFSKLGTAKFISHLDLDRTMKTVIARSGLNAEFTHGFNPRPYLVFSLPLPVGVESVCEFLDIRIAGDVSFEEIRERINKNLPDDIRVTECYEQKMMFKDIYSASYEFTLISPKLTEEINLGIKEMVKAPVIIEKHTKKTESGFIDFDIAPYIYELSADFDGECEKINVLLSAATGSYINPENLMKAFSKYLDLSFDDPTTDSYSIIRTNVYVKDSISFR